MNSNFETEPGQHWVTTPQHFGTSHKYNFGIFSNNRLYLFKKNNGILSNNRLSQIPNLVSSWALLIQANRGGQPTRVKALDPFFSFFFRLPLLSFQTQFYYITFKI